MYLELPLGPFWGKVPMILITWNPFVLKFGLISATTLYDLKHENGMQFLPCPYPLPRPNKFPRKY